MKRTKQEMAITQQQQQQKQQQNKAYSYMIYESYFEWKGDVSGVVFVLAWKGATHRSAGECQDI